MSDIGDIKTFNFSYTGLTLKVDVIDLGGGNVKIIVTCVNGAADINALYWSDGVADSSNFDLGTKKDNSLNMNGTGEDWDGGMKLSSTGLGSEGTAKPTYLTTGETFVIESTSLGANTFDTLDTFGIRATSTSTAEGSIKAVDNEETLTECPHVRVDDVTVAEEAGNAVFTVTIDEPYLYDVKITYTFTNGSADGSDYTGTPGTITILAGQTSATITVPILDDNNPESTETFTVNLTGATAVLPGNDLNVTSCIQDNAGIGTITDTDTTGGGGGGPADIVTANDDPDFACGVEGLVKVTGNVLENDEDSLGDDLDITHINSTALSSLTPDVNGFYTVALSDGTLKINAETGDFEFTYSGVLPVGGHWEGSFNYTVTDGDPSDDDVEASDYTATVNLCADAAAGSPGYWAQHDGSGPQANDWDIAQNTSFETYFGVTGPYGGQWDIVNPVNGIAGLVADITLRQSFDIPQGGSGGQNHLAQEGTTALLNLLDEDAKDGFITAYIYQRANHASADPDADNDLSAFNEAQILADLKQQVQDAFTGAPDAYTIAELTDLLIKTHE